VASSCTYLPYCETGYFSSLAMDYMQGHQNLAAFYTYSPDKNGIAAAIQDRNKYPIDRKNLVNTLTAQYALLDKHPKAEQNLALLLQDTTYTICTAHQPNLLTGYLYFIYKILHAIKLSEDLQALHPDKNFVPVYYMGSEDNDLEELGTFRYENRKFIWEADGQKGAVGRMTTESLKPLLDELFALLGPPGENCEELKRMIGAAYMGHTHVGAATQYLVNELFGRYGLIVLNPDDANFKKCIVPIMQEELLHQHSYGIVNKQIESLSVHYKAQAHPRPINLFYLDDQIRERIEQHGDVWQVLNTDIQWTKNELLAALQSHPERFSPNVILRGLLQESILPNVVFIGGGAEVAYWLQLKPLFTHYQVFYPSIHLRQSVLWIDPREAKLRQQLSCSIAEIFKPETELIRAYVLKNSTHDWQTSTEQAEIESILLRIKQKATVLDPTLKASAEAATAKIQHRLQVMEKKMLRAEKQHMQVHLLKIGKLKGNLFPNNSLQERVENFCSYYLQYGPAYLDILKEHMRPLEPAFMVIENN